MVEAVRKYNRIVQVGTQSRSQGHKRRAIELLQQGAIGKVYMARGLCFKRRPTIGKTPDGPVPPGVDYDLWRGPAPMRPFNPNRFHYNWHWFWDTGNGDIGNQGAHEIDICRWGLNKNVLPNTVYSAGAKYIYDDDQETPNTLLSVFQYDDCEIVFEVRGLVTGSEAGINENPNHIGNIFYGSDGYLSIDVNGFEIRRGERRELAEKGSFTEPERWDTRPHVANFLDAVRSRNQNDLHADVEQGHLSAALCHLANISYRTGRKLKFDPKTERFVNDSEANRLLTRDYRKPYVVPEKV
jgi:predicted dehydrogenase